MSAVFQPQGIQDSRGNHFQHSTFVTIDNLNQILSFLSFNTDNNTDNSTNNNTIISGNDLGSSLSIRIFIMGKYIFNKFMIMVFYQHALADMNMVLNMGMYIF